MLPIKIASWAFEDRLFSIQPYDIKGIEAACQAAVNEFANREEKVEYTIRRTAPKETTVIIIVRPKTGKPSRAKLVLGELSPEFYENLHAGKLD